MDNSFIRYKEILADAQVQDESIEVEKEYLGTVHLKPFDLQPYYQVTKTDFDFNIGTYTVDVINPCTGTVTDVTDSVLITTFTEDGLTQGIIRYADFQKDFGKNLVYFRITHGATALGLYYYSNLLLITADDINKTSRLDYYDNTRAIPVVGDDGYIQSIRLQMYFKNHATNTEIDAYYQISQEQTINSRILENSLKEWYLLTNAWTFKRLEKAMYNGGFWIDQVRQYITSPMEYNPREEESNISEQKFITDPDEGDFLNIIEVEITPSMVAMLASSDKPASNSQLISEILTTA